MIDLHTHTSASDGLLPPARLVELAARCGVRVLAVTDHDTVGGIDEAIESAKGLPLRIIPGIEFSVDFPRGSFHLVGLYIDHADEELRNALARLKGIRDGRGERIIAELKKAGVDIPLHEVIAEASGGSLGKPHFARVMVRHGYARSTEEVFERYLVGGRPGDVPKEKITPAEAIRLVRAAGGIPVLAHPSSLEMPSVEAFEHLLDDLVSMGLMGVEAYASLHTAEEVPRYESIARGRGLLVSGGSDFHGDRAERPGWYADNTPIPEGLIDEIDRHRGV
jgi:predicted metal-dependent phosphoesterase TrpH